MCVCVRACVCVCVCVCHARLAPIFDSHAQSLYNLLKLHIADNNRVTYWITILATEQVILWRSVCLSQWLAQYYDQYCPFSEVYFIHTTFREFALPFYAGGQLIMTGHRVRKMNRQMCNSYWKGYSKDMNFCSLNSGSSYILRIDLLKSILLFCQYLRNAWCACNVL